MDQRLSLPTILMLVVGVLGAGLAWFLIGRRDPLHAVFDMADERGREDYVPTGTPQPSDGAEDQDPDASSGVPTDPTDESPTGS